MDSGELLERLSATLRNQIGPAVDDEYTRTQAYMAAVILEKVGRQVALAPDHDSARRAELAELHRDLGALLGRDQCPTDLVAAVDRAGDVGTVDALGPVIAELYRWGVDTNPAAAAALDRIRITLRSDIDRSMEIAR